MLRALASLVTSLVLLALPTLTVWLGGSLIAFHGGPLWLALGGGLLLFPVLPALWEWRSSVAWKAGVARRKQFAGTPKRTFTTFTRVSLRTVFICLAFTGGMVAAYPKVTFAALATRGDWFLPRDAESEIWRTLAFGLANRLELLHRLANPNPYQLEEQPPSPTASVAEPTPIVPSGSSARWRRLTDEERAALEGTPARPPPVLPDAGASTKDDDGQLAVISWTDEDSELDGLGRALERTGDDPDSNDPPPAPPPVTTTGDTHWPWQDLVSPTVQGMHPHDETSLVAVALYIRSREPEPFKRVKALHDWVVTRLTYDDASTVPGQRKPQDPNTVFVNRLAVCEGYARLFRELGRHTGDEIVYLTGDVRESNGAAASSSHAWNAVKISGAWYLVDTTWDDPKRTDGVALYRTDYLFIPPEVAIFSHFPDDTRWQLLPKALSRGEFLRQPFARPSLAREQLTMRQPVRSAVDSGETLAFEIDNPLRRFLWIQYVGGGQTVDCGTTNDTVVRASCRVPASGEAIVLSNGERYGQFNEVMTVAVTRR